MVLNGITFDSQKEARRWQALLVEQQGGLIQSLRRQVPIRVPVKNVVTGEETIAFVYRADFYYIRGGKRVVEDVKSPMTKKLPMYRLKKRMLKAVYGIEIVET